MTKFNSPPVQKTKKVSKNQKYFVLAPLALLLASCKFATDEGLVKIGDVSGQVTSGDDVVTLGANGLSGTVDLGAGNDSVVGGDAADLIRGGAGADNIQGGAGLDSLVIIGKTTSAAYSRSDLTDPNGTGVDLSSLISLEDVNNNSQSDAQAGEVIDGGADGAILFVYGLVDFTGITLVNITRIDVHSEITIPATTLKGLIDGGVFSQLHGDGTTELTITHDGTPIELDFSGIDMQNIGQLTVQAGVTLVLDQADLTGTLIINGDGTIQAVTGLLDLDGIQVSSNIVILDQAGAEILPTFTGVPIEDIAENSTNVGTFAVTVASTVGEVTYALSGADASLFTITSSGEVNFKTAPDFEVPSDTGTDNVYDITVTATDSRGKAASENVAITVTNLNDLSFTSVTIANLPENSSAVIIDVNTNHAATFSLVGGADSANFTVNTATGELSYTGANQDFDALGAITYDVVVRATDASNDTQDQTLVITLENVNENAIYAPHSFNIAENNQNNIVDLNAATLFNTYSIIGGADADKFTIDNDGKISFISNPNFESPTDVGSDSVYNLIVQADDVMNTDVSTANISITVTDDNDTPAGSVTITGNTKDGETLTVTHSLTDEDGLGTVSYQWQRDGVDIFAATNATYTLNQADVGSEITVMVAYLDGQSNNESIGSSPTSVITVGASFALAALTGSNGFRVDGQAQYDNVGEYVSSAGDINGDGYDDIIVSAPGADYGYSNSGSIYVVFGSDSSANPDIDLSSLDGTTGFRFDGYSSEEIGKSVSSAGDINGDGYDDLLVGAPWGDGNWGANARGTTYVIFGKTSGYSATMDYSDLDGTAGFALHGMFEDDQAGYSVSAAGDFNNDGFDDILIGSPYYDGSADQSGVSFIMFGKSSGFSADFELNSIDGTNGIGFYGQNIYDSSGKSVSSVGDINGDGFEDIIIAAPGANNDGSAYIVFGHDSTAFSFGFGLASLDGSDGFRVDGFGYDSKFGNSVSGAGDINGDGFDDLIIGVPYGNHKSDFYGPGNDYFGSNLNNGSAYVIFGTDGGFVPVLDLETLNGTNGFRLDGENAGQHIGYSVSSAGDINGDGYADIIVGMEYGDYSASNSGSSYVVFGHETGFSATFDLENLDGSNGFRIDGVAASEYSSRAVSSAGDINGDGYDDLLIGALGVNHAAPYHQEGSAYIIYGGKQFAVTVNSETSGNDTITGDTSANTLNGSDGDDMLSGLGNSDILIGGQGNDTLIGGTGADKLWGGGKIDIFTFAAGDSSVSITGSNNAGAITGYDTIFDFKTSSANFLSETFDTVGTASIVADTTGIDGANSSLTIDGEQISKHAISSGIITFDDDNLGNAAISVNSNAELAAVIEYLQSQDIGDAGSTVAFEYGADTFVYTQGSDDSVDDTLDILAYLEDVQADSLITTNALGPFDLFIA